MTQEPNEQNNNQPQPQIEKLLIDNPQNFQFHAAYMVYSETFDKISDPQAKQALNQNIQDLNDSIIDSETFYLNISTYRNMERPRRERFTVSTQRKRDWRKKEQRQDRIKRHKK